MLRTRLWMGTLLALLALGVLFLDNRLAPWYPFLFLLVTALGLVAAHELRAMLEPRLRPSPWLCHGCVLLVVAANWPPHLWDWARSLSPDPWHWVAAALAAVVLATLLEAMARFELDATQEGVDVLL